MTEEAEAKAAEDEREVAERHADYERRKVAGELTPMEIASAFVPSLWAGELSKIGDTVTIPHFANLVNRSFEDEVKA